ncbi:unnamed protein product [Brassicogethes aeneus]|uniref:Protein kinase domain-containing protein n=1 Tax=Brassicogethes aeneus TaxID=1431903 RepID=A0A9P0FPH5_BRAAE|nr:unnamed protein product [Brassicogethes aeneus]
MDPNHRMTSEEILKHSFFTHDRFPQRFLPALREKVNLEFNNPLLRKFKTEIIMSTDKKDEVKPRRSSNDQRWRFTLHEGSMKRKYSCDVVSNENDKSLITLTKSSQRLNVTQKNNSTMKPSKEKAKGNNMLEMQMLEKSLESLAKFSTKEERPLSAQKESLSPLLRTSPQQFQSLHYHLNDFQKSPNILQPSINNISFNKDFTKKVTPVTTSSNQRPAYLKKLERNIVLENYSTTNDESSPLWLNSFSTNLRRRKECSKGKIDDFVLPNLPGASGSPHKPKKKSLPEIDLSHSNQVTPYFDYVIPIFHRDVKPENVLVSSLGVVKLCDFGFTRHVSTMNEPYTEYVATRWYRAPELLVGKPNYGAPVDIWAIGCLFAEMITGDPIYPGDSDIDQLYLIVKMLGKPCLRHQQLMLKNAQLKGMIKSPTGENNLYKTFPSWSLQAIDFLSGCIKMDPNHRMTSEEILKHSFFTHDRFPQRFLPALREKVNLDFNNPLLRKFKTEIIMSTDKKDEVKPRRSSNDQRWRFTFHEGSMKRKYSCDVVNNENDKSLITLTKSSQRLNVTQKNNSTMKSSKEKAKGNNMLEMQMLEKSLESLAKFSTKEERPLSAQKESLSPLLRTSPQQFQSLHYHLNDFQKSPNILQPSINNISFNKDFTKKVTPVTTSSNQRPAYLKKLERNIVLENYSTTNDESSPLWLNSFSTNLRRRKECSKGKIDDFVLPNLPGASGSPHKPKKKSLPEIDLSHSNQVTPVSVTVDKKLPLY